MVTWFAEFLLNVIVMIICYLTNPVVCLFATELGELTGFLVYWQTWDDTLDPEFFVKGKVLKIFRYDYDKHYEEYKGTTPELEHVGRERWFTRFVEGGEVFTTKEKIQRYICRVLWLTRNCGYGFAFWVFGREVDSKDLLWVKNSENEKYVYEVNQAWWNRTFMYKARKHLFANISLDIFLGWKISDEPGIHQAMIANRIVFSIDD